MKKLMLLSIALAMSTGAAFAKDEDPLKGKIRINNETNNNVTIMVTYKKKNVPDDQRYVVDKKSFTTINFENKDIKSGSIEKLDKVDANDKTLASLKTDIKEKGIYKVTKDGIEKA